MHGRREYRPGAEESSLAPPPAKPTLWLVQQRSLPVNQTFAVGQTAIQAWQAAKLKSDDGAVLDFASVQTSMVPEHMIEEVEDRVLKARMVTAPKNGAAVKSKRKRPRSTK